MSERQLLPVSLAEAWEALNDLALLQQAIPGCESLVETGAGRFDATMALPVGPLTTRFTARLRRSDVEAPHACTLHFEADAMGGRSVGRAGLRLRDDGDAGTVLAYDVEVQVEGLLANLGGTLVDLAAQRMAREFFERFRDGLVERHAKV